MVERREIVMEPTKETLEEDLVNIENNIIENLELKNAAEMKILSSNKFTISTLLDI